MWPCLNLTVTRGRRARPTSGARPWAWSRPGRCCGSGRRSAADVGVRTASWPWLQTGTDSPPQRRSRACAEDDPRCKPSAAPEERSGWGQRPLGGEGGAGHSSMRFSRWIKMTLHDGKHFLHPTLRQVKWTFLILSQVRWNDFTSQYDMKCLDGFDRHFLPSKPEFPTKTLQ